MGATPEQIASWKKEHGNIFSVAIGSTEFIFREVTFSEFDDVISRQQTEDSAEAEDFLVRTALLYPEMAESDYDLMPAGVVTSIAEEVLEQSGMASPKKAKGILEKYREQNTEVRSLMKAFILATMPAYKEEELDFLTFSQMAKKVALAEQIIKINQAAFGVENEITLDLIDPEEEAQKQDTEKQKHAAYKKPGQAGAEDPIAQKLAQALGG